MVPEITLKQAQSKSGKVMMLLCCLSICSTASYIIFFKGIPDNWDSSFKGLSFYPESLFVNMNTSNLTIILGISNIFSLLEIIIFYFVCFEPVGKALCRNREALYYTYILFSIFYIFRLLSLIAFSIDSNNVDLCCIVPVGGNVVMPIIFPALNIIMISNAMAIIAQIWTERKENGV